MLVHKSSVFVQHFKKISFVIDFSEHLFLVRFSDILYLAQKYILEDIQVKSGESVLRSLMLSLKNDVKKENKKDFQLEDSPANTALRKIQ